MSTINLRKGFLKFMISISLLEKSDIQSFVTSIEVSQMTNYSCKPNKLRNINTIRRGRRVVAIKNVNIKIIAFVINFG